MPSLRPPVIGNVPASPDIGITSMCGCWDPPGLYVPGMEGFTFTDCETGSDGWCNVRVVGEGVVGLTTSLRSDGDTGLFLSASDAQRLANLLLAAGA